MTNTVYTKIYEKLEINKEEILRYAGIHGDAPQLEKLLQSCLEELEGKLTYKVCYMEFPANCSGEVLDLGFCRVLSASLKKNLVGCRRIVLFAATVGIGIDRLIARYGTVSPAKALMFQAIGAERIESLCDRFNKEINERIAAQGLVTRPRFSPGYGDLPLEVQRGIFDVLDCPRKIGLTLNESMLMSPSKSVTAMIGIGCKMPNAGETKCGGCENRKCEYRRER